MKEPVTIPVRPSDWWQLLTASDKKSGDAFERWYLDRKPHKG